MDAVQGESDTTDNCSLAVEVEVSEPTAPDLEVGMPTVDDANPETGGSFTLSATVTNAGDGAAAATTLRYYRSADATITTSDAQAGTDAVDGLAASGMSPELIALTAPATLGTYYYGACVDAVSKESNTENNCSAATQLTVPDPPPRMGYDLARRRRRCSVAHRRRILKAGLGVRRSGITTPSELSTVNSSGRCAMGRDATGDKAHATSACVEQIEPEQTPGRCSTFR